MSSLSVFHNVDPEVFARDIRSQNRPAILRGLISDWPAVALGRQSDEALVDYLKRHDNGQPAGIYVGVPSIKGAFFYGNDTHSENFRYGPAPLAQVLERLMSERSVANPTALYVQSAVIAKHMPGFSKENRLDLLPETVEPRIWIGNEVVTRTHYDISYNVAAVVTGRRRFFLFPPEQLINLYPGPFDRTIGGVPVSMVDPENPDLTRYPRFAEALKTMQTADLEPGDALYLPYGWWHHVRSLSSFNVLVNYWWDDAPPQSASPYDALFHAMLAIRDLPEDQLSVWRTMFDYYALGRHGDPLSHLDSRDKGSLGPLTPDLITRIRKSLAWSLSQNRQP